MAQNARQMKLHGKTRDGLCAFTISEKHGIWENNTGHGKSRVTVNREMTVLGIKSIKHEII